IFITSELTSQILSLLSQGPAHLLYRNFVQFSKVYCFNNATFKVYNIIHNQSRTNLKFLFFKSSIAQRQRI
ncbi:MAG: hypothetical protein LKJ22_09125, partial [Liquorilactobacillus nagelii]|uniref:hypothetical protein n=1 Tax=Liquorilactobacillus nagelii TaxID=82688 RepID=UPI002430496B